MFRLAWRRLLGARRYTIVMMLTIALGVSANATVYSMLAGLLSRAPAGVQDPTSLIQIGRGERADNLDMMSFPLFEAIRRHVHTLGTLAAFGSAEALVGPVGSGATVGVQLVSGEYFDLLGVRPFLGRVLDRDDERLARGAVTVVSHGYWQRELSARRDVIGQTLIINGHAFTVIGVAPPRFAGADAMARAPMAWVPVGAFAIVTGADPARFESPRMSWLRVAGRLPVSAPVERAQSVLTTALSSIELALPGSAQEGLVAVRGMRALPRERVVIDRIGGLLRVLVSLLLVITCANVAVLALARVTARRGDIAISLALGATQRDLLRAMFAEALVLAALAASAAAGLTVLATIAVRRLLPYDVAADFRPHTAVLLAVGVVALGVTVLSSLGPAMSVTQVGLREALAGSASRGATKGGTRFRHTLVALQFCCCLVLVAVSIACVRSIRASASASPGFVAANVFSATVRVSPYATDAERLSHWRSMRDRLAALPGLTQVGAVAALPLVDRQASMVPFSLDALRAGRGRLPDPIRWTSVAGDYFAAVQIPVVAGRAFDAGDDREGAARVAIISRTLATRLFGNGTAVGQRLPFGEAGDPPTTVIGVVADAQTTSLIDRPTGMLYYPLSQRASATYSMVVRSERESAAVAAGIISALHSVSQTSTNASSTSVANDQPVLVIRGGWLQPQVAASLRDTRLLGTLTTVFSTVALVLAAVGVFGSLAFNVELRRREFGIRLALGATPRRIVRQVLGDALRVAGVGALCGIPAVLAAQQLLRGFLYQASPIDPLVVLLTLMVMAGTALFAAWLPATRAARTAPARVLGDA